MEEFGRERKVKTITCMANLLQEPLAETLLNDGHCKNKNLKTTSEKYCKTKKLFYLLTCWIEPPRYKKQKHPTSAFFFLIYFFFFQADKDLNSYYLRLWSQNHPHWYLAFFLRFRWFKSRQKLDVNIRTKSGN